MTLHRIFSMLAIVTAGFSCTTTGGGGGLGPGAGSPCTQAQHDADAHICGGPSTVLKCKPSSGSADAGSASGFAWEASQCGSGKVCESGDCTVPSAAGPDTSSSGSKAKASGVWNGTCSGDQQSGTFDVEVDASGIVSGKLKGDSIGSISGVLSAGGSLKASATGTAGNCPWTGTLTKMGSSLTGSGQWSCSPCSGTWKTN